MKQFMIRKTVITFMTFAVLALCIPARCALADDSPSEKTPSVGITIGEEGKRCYFYSEPDENMDHAVGFYYPGSKVYITDRINEWYHIYYVADGYMKAEDLAVLHGVEQIQTIGYAFSSFEKNDPDISPDGFVRFRIDCDCGKSGDVVSSGAAFELIGYAGDMLQVKRGAFKGFIPGNKARVITLQDLLFTEKPPKIYGPGSYSSGTGIPSGLYQVRADKTTGALILSKDTGEKISYALDTVAGTCYTIFIPKKVNVHIPLGCSLSQVTSRQPEGYLSKEGRYLCGVDFAGLPDRRYEVTASGHGDSYYIISNLLGDQTMDKGTIYPLSPGESILLEIFPGEYVEIYHGSVKEKWFPG